MATPIGVGIFVAALANAAATQLTFPAMTTLSAGINASVTTIPLASWPWLWPTGSGFAITIGTELMTVVSADPVAKTLLVVGRGSGVSHSIGAAVDWTNPLRVIEGSTPTDQETDDGKAFIQNIKTDGPFLKIGFPEFHKEKQVDWYHTGYEISCILYFGVDQNSARSLVDVMSLLECLKNLWFDQKVYPAGSFSTITDMFTQVPTIDYTQNPAFAQLPMLIKTRG